MKQYIAGLLKIILVVCGIATLTACVYGSAAVTGAQAVYDRHNLQKKISDNYASFQVYRDIYLNPDLDKNTNIAVATFNNAVLLTGQIPSLYQKMQIRKIVANAVGSRKIYDFTEQANPSSVLTRASDSWITAKIKTQLVAINEADPTQIKVITENGTVYLMGVVYPEQADIAVRVAQTTRGVQSVVKIFSYLQVTQA